MSGCSWMQLAAAASACISRQHSCELFTARAGFCRVDAAGGNGEVENSLLSRVFESRPCVFILQVSACDGRRFESHLLQCFCFYFSACPLALIMLDARCDCRQVGGFSSLPCIRRLCSCCCQPLGRLAGDAAAGSGVLLSGVNVGTPCTATAALPPATCCTRGAGPALLHCKNRSRHFDDHSMANFYYNIVVTAT